MSSHAHSHGHGHGHSHGLIDPSIKRSRAGLRAVGWSLLILLVTAVAQAFVFVATGSVALLADLIHNAGDALTAVPLAVAFALRSARAERSAGYFVVGAIFFSACVAAIQAVDRLMNPQDLEHLLALGIAGAVGFAGNETGSGRPPARRPAPRQPGAGRRRLSRAHRRAGQPRRRRRGAARRPRPPGRRPAHRACDLARDPAHHLAVLADRARWRAHALRNHSRQARAPSPGYLCDSVGGSSPDPRGMSVVGRTWWE